MQDPIRRARRSRDHRQRTTSLAGKDSVWVGLLLLLLAGAGSAEAAVLNGENELRKPRDVYNQGTQKFRQGKLREAEMSLQAAVASNDEAVQPVALYNLAHVRFQQGVEALKDSPDGKATETRGRRASTAGDAAIAKADEALAGYDLEAIIEAYMHGRGVRRQLKAATEAVKRALEAYGAVLMRWQRASGDFKSAHELRRADEDASFNAEIVDRCIAELVDREQAMKIAMRGAEGKRQELRERMEQLKKLMPKMIQAQCQNDDEDEEDEGEQPKEPQKGQERESREGREMAMTWEEAMRLLESLKLDSNRKLPMGMNQTGNPKNRAGREW